MGDAIRSGQGCPGASQMARVVLRVTLDERVGTCNRAARVHWEVDDSTGRLRGDQTVIAVLGSGCRDSELRFEVPSDEVSTSTAVRCTVTWIEEATGQCYTHLCYALHGKVSMDKPRATRTPAIATGGKHAVIVGVSKYSRRSGDLEWCDGRVCPKNRQPSPPRTQPRGTTISLVAASSAVSTATSFRPAWIRTDPTSDRWRPIPSPLGRSGHGAERSPGCSGHGCERPRARGPSGVRGLQSWQWRRPRQLLARQAGEKKTDKLTSDICDTFPTHTRTRTTTNVRAPTGTNSWPRISPSATRTKRPSSSSSMPASRAHGTGGRRLWCLQWRDPGGARGQPAQQLRHEHVHPERVRIRRPAAGIGPRTRVLPVRESIHAHGAWTQSYLIDGLQRREAEGGKLDLVDVFQEAHANYVKQHRARGDRPCCFMSVRRQRYNTNDGDEDPQRLPRGVVCVKDVFGTAT